MPLKSEQQILDMFFGESGATRMGWKKRAEAAINLQHQYAREWFGFWAGDRAWYNTGVLTPRKSMVVINRVKPLITATAGFMRQLSRQPDYQARDEDDQAQVQRSEYTNGVSYYFRERMNAEQTESLQNLHMLIGGYGAIDTNISSEEYGTTRDPNGEILQEVICPWEVWWDPMAHAPNLLDARYVFRKKKFMVEDAINLFSAKEEDFVNDYNITNDRYTFFPGGNTDRIAISSPETGNDRGMVDVYYLQWWEREPFWRVENPVKALAQFDPGLAKQLLAALTRLKDVRTEEADERYQPDIFSFDPMADILVLDKQMLKDIKSVFEAFSEPFKAIGIEPEFDKGQRRCYYTSIFTRNKVFTSFKSLDQNGFTIKFKTADYDPNNKLWFGLVAILKEPTLYSNKALTEILYIIAANSKGGVLYERSAVDDPTEFEQKWAQTAGAVEVNDGAISGGKIMQKAAAVLPNGYDSLYPEFVQAVQDVFLVDKTALGNSDNKQETAQLQRQRIRQVYTTLAMYFDADILYLKEEARLLLTYFRALAENSPGRFFSYVNQDGKRAPGRLYSDMLTGDYDIIIGEMPDTPTQQEEAAQYMLNAATTMAQMPDPKNIFDVAFKYAKVYGIKQADIQAVIERVKPQPPQQPSPEEQEMNKIMMEAQKAEMQNRVADAAYKQAGVAERQANTAKIFSEAQQKHLENEAIVKVPASQVSVNI
jgi:hypothetical protein